MLKLVLGVVLSVSLLIGLGAAYAQGEEIPSWVKNAASWWASGEVGDDEFFRLVEFLVERGVIVVPDRPGDPDRISQLEDEMSKLKEAVAADVRKAYDDGYQDGLDDGRMEASGPAPVPGNDTAIDHNDNDDNQNDDGGISLDDDPIKGDPDAPVTIVEFSDFQCPFCSRFYHQTLPQIEQNYIETGKVNLVYRDMPLGIHSNAIPAHVAAECADEQGAFWQYHDVLFDRQSQWGRLGEAALDTQLKAYAVEIGLDSRFGECLVSPEVEAEVRHDHSQARGYGVTGTPTFFVGNEDTGYTRLTGAQPYASFQSVIDSILK